MVSQKSKDSVKTASNKYTGDQIIVLEGLEPVRKRPAMYIGSTSLSGVHHCITEIIDNSVDEALAGFAKNVWMIIHQDNSVTVIDDGRGIPTTKVEKADLPAVYGEPDIPSKFKPKINSGTITSFYPDREIFKEGISADYDTIRKQVKERAYLVSGLYFHLLDTRDGREDHFYFEGGISSLVEALNRNKIALHDPIFIQKQSDSIEVQAAIQYNDSFSENVESFVNVINTIEGGSHLTGFRMALTRSIN